MAIQTTGQHQLRSRSGDRAVTRHAVVALPTGVDSAPLPQLRVPALKQIELQEMNHLIQRAIQFAAEFDPGQWQISAHGNLDLRHYSIF